MTWCLILGSVGCTSFDANGPYQGTVVESNKMAKPFWAKVQSETTQWPDGLTTIRTKAQPPLQQALDHAVASARMAMARQPGHESGSQPDVKDIYYEAINRIDSETLAPESFYEIYILIK